MPIDFGSPRRIAALRAAVADLEAARPSVAAARCNRLLSADPNDPDALFLAGLAAGAHGQSDDAAAILLRVAAARPDQPHPFHDLASLLRRLHRTELIAPTFHAAVAAAPDDARLCRAYAEDLLEDGEAAAAIEVLANLLRSHPPDAATHAMMGVALADLGLTSEAIGHLRQAVSLNPTMAAAWSNLGLLLKTENRFADALAAHDTALAISPYEPQFRVNRVVTLLRAGRWLEAWPDYEYRLRLPGQTPPSSTPLLPAVATGASLSGRVVLAPHENGFGDSLQFARYLPLLAARGAHVVAVMPAQLVRIMRSLPDVTVIGPDDPRPEADYVCPLCSLPRVFQTEPDTIPASGPYLHADPAAAASWAARLPAGAPRVGLVWAGQARAWLPDFNTLNARRSMSLATLAHLLSVPDVQFIGLQNGPAASEVAADPRLFDPMPAVSDFADTAAIISNLDLVISVDTAVVHLAGALGKPAFMLDRYDNCWRWLSGRNDSPWYPRLRIFRQQRIGEWDSVIRQAADALGTFVRTGDNWPARPAT